MPSFLILAIVGCLLGRNVFHEPLDRLGVDVSVPLISAFLLSRILVLFVPRTEATVSAPPSVLLLLRGVSLLIFWGIVIGFTFLFSAALYRTVGFDSASHTALRWAAYGLGEAVVVFIIFVGAVYSARILIMVRIQLLQSELEEIFWGVLHAPTQLVDALCQDSCKILRAR